MHVGLLAPAAADLDEAVVNAESFWGEDQVAVVLAGGRIRLVARLSTAQIMVSTVGQDGGQARRRLIDPGVMGHAVRRQWS
jgi:hypothetical protein